MWCTVVNSAPLELPIGLSAVVCLHILDHAALPDFGFRFLHSASGVLANHSTSTPFSRGLLWSRLGSNQGPADSCHIILLWPNNLLWPLQGNLKSYNLLSEKCFLILFVVVWTMLSPYWNSCKWMIICLLYRSLMWVTWPPQAHI